MRSALLACLVALAAVAAGCAKPADDLTPGATNDGGTPDATTPDAPTAPASGGNATPSPSAPGSGSINATAPAPSGNGSAPATSSREATWAPVASAKVRPGVQVIIGDFQCTANFVFTSPDNLTAYLGLAAHCVSSKKLGDAVDIGPGLGKGTIAYSSWYVTGHSIPDPTTGQDPGTCTNETSANVCAFNDFALIELDDATRAVTNPSMLQFGGPVALANSSAVQTLDKVITYGNSGLRQGLSDTSPHEGYVTEQTNPWTTTVFTATPGIPGDSGSGVMLGDGRALGILVTITEFSSDPFQPPASNGVTSLDLALAWAAEHGGPRVQLATAPLLDGGVLPA